MRVLVTGSNGFLGRNLVARLRERSDVEVQCFTRQSSWDELSAQVRLADAVIHLAGVNRPIDDAEFFVHNAGLTSRLCEMLAENKRKIPVVYASSIQVERDNPYGRSKRQAEQALSNLHAATGIPVRIFRLPNVFGKWCRPNYNSVVATFCHNIARGLPLEIDDRDAVVTLVYVDDVVSSFIGAISTAPEGNSIVYDVRPTYRMSVGELADQLRAFQNCRNTLVCERVGVGLVRALYATYVSYLPVEGFVYDLPAYADARGTFVEVLKTYDTGQFSYFTAGPGVTRGGHYHHTKTEKFLVVRGAARFRFRHLLTGEYHEVTTSSQRPQIVETIPGWAHDITNISAEEMIVMLWASEVFDRDNPDTFGKSAAP